MPFFVYFTMKGGQQPVRSAPSPGTMAEIATFHEEALKSGVIVATGRLSANATRIRKDGDDVSVADRELVGMPELRVAEIRG